MSGDEPSADEPTTVDRTAAERAADAAEEADKTDMGAVGDDGQVFGG